MAMDFNDAVKYLKTDNPDCNESDLRSAMDAQVKEETERLKQAKCYSYARAVAAAYDRIKEWLKTGDEFVVALDWRDLAGFSLRMPACVYCVFVAKARVAEQENKAA